MENTTHLIERTALKFLDTYEGANNYILKLKHQSQVNKKFYPTRSQSDYIINFHDTQPKVAKKWVDLDPYFAQKIADEKLYTVVPEQVWVEKLLVEKDKSYHIWGKIFSGETNHDFWLPKNAIIKAHKVEQVEIDYSKYEHRPPLGHQKEAIEKLVGSKRFILADDMGLGKALEINTKIYTSDGVKKMGDIKVGDKVIGSDGNSHNVTGVYPQGLKDLYRMTFNDGCSILCCDEHIWTVSTRANGNNSKGRKTLTLNLTTKQLLDKELKVTRNSNSFDKLQSTYYLQSNGQSKWQIPIVKPITFDNNEELPIHPYLLGLILGDGGITKSIRFSSIDDEIIEEIKKLLTDDLEIKKTSGDNCDYDIVTKIRGKNSLIDKLRQLNLMGCNSSQKFIPDVYKYSSIENRLLILQGLMDTDGFCYKSRKNNEFLGTEFCSISEQLTDDVIEIVHTLGGIARKSSRIPKYTYNGEKKNGKKAYRVNIKLQSEMNPFKLQRKKELYKEPQKYKVGRYIKKIEFERKGDAVCISVDSPDKLYVAEHCIVTHNTTSTIIAALETGAKKILIICPASLKINWQREIANYSDRSVFICESKNFSTEHDFVITNYDIIKNFYDIKDKENSPIYQCNFDLIIIDEAHYLQNVQAQRTKLINSFAKSVDKLWLLTGTPMTSRPINYYNLLSLIENPVAGNWMAYVIRYCQGYQFRVGGNRKIWNTSGASNLEELRDRTSKQVLRRLKEDVLDLPDKIITPVYLRLRSKLYEELMGEYYDWYKTKAEESSSMTLQFTKLTKVRQIIADEKIESSIELAENIVEQGKKVIIFTNFTASLQKLVEHFGKKAVYVDGSCSPAKRQNAVDEFQTNDKIKVFVGNLKAAGVGLTLTAGEAVIMNDLSFVPSDHSQGEDRAYRYGQKSNVSVYYPIFENTIEGVIYDILSKKKNIFETVMGDNLDKVDVVEEIMRLINNKS